MIICIVTKLILLICSSKRVSVMRKMGFIFNIGYLSIEYVSNDQIGTTTKSKL